jgi:hypothetical protein
MLMLFVSHLLASLVVGARFVPPFVNLPISKTLNLTAGETLVTRDLARISSLRARADRTSGQPINSLGLHSHYTVSIQSENFHYSTGSFNGL